MIESFVSVNVVSSVMGALIAIYVILGVMFAAGVFALFRLSALAKRAKHLEGVTDKDCEDCAELKEKEKQNAELRASVAEKDQQIAAQEEELRENEGKIREQAAQIETKDEEIAALREIIRELEARPAEVKEVVVPVVAPVAAPAEEPAEVPVEVRTLSESLAIASEEGTKGDISKQSILEYLSGKYGYVLELNSRPNRTPNGKLLLSDNHFAFTEKGKRVCFAYVYETDEGQVVSLIKLDEPYAKELFVKHPEVRRSAFPKNKANDWYSVVEDASFTPASYYAVLDHAIELIRGTSALPSADDVPEVSLRESIAEAKDFGAVGVVTKQSIIEHLSETFGDKVELNARPNRTPNGKLLLSDNHFAITQRGKRVCFSYVYQDDDGKVIVLLRTTSEHAQAIRAVHKATGVRSAFPKNKEKDWYSVVVDGTFSGKDVYDLLDRAVLNIIGAKAEVVASEEPEEGGVSLKESLAATKDHGVTGIVTKKSVMERLSEVYGDKVELNGRENRTPNGKLLLSDNHFAIAHGKRICFTYVYEDDGKIMMLVRTSEQNAAAIRAAHKETGVRSAFPKNKDKDWYSVVVDDTFTDKDVYDVLKGAYDYVLTK